LEKHRPDAQSCGQVSSVTYRQSEEGTNLSGKQKQEGKDQGKTACRVSRRRLWSDLDYRVCALFSRTSFNVARRLCTTKNRYETHSGISIAALSKLECTVSLRNDTRLILRSAPDHGALGSI
jgi:hypothetical protein